METRGLLCHQTHAGALPGVPPLLGESMSVRLPGNEVAIGDQARTPVVIPIRGKYPLR